MKHLRIALTRLFDRWGFSRLANFTYPYDNDVILFDYQSKP